MYSKCRVDLIDTQSEPDGEYKFMMNYQDHLTKYCVFDLLKPKPPSKLLITSLPFFSLFGAPFILQSDNGREFSNSVINNLKSKWPELKIVHGKPRHFQAGFSREVNQDVRDAGCPMKIQKKNGQMGLDLSKQRGHVWITPKNWS
jgi:hypothetical protein